MSGGESYEVQVQSSMHNVRLGYSGDGSAMYKPMVSSPSPTPTYQLTVSGVGGDGSAVAAAVAAPQPSINTSAGESMKRKRGRPRKYAPDGSMALTVKSTPPLSGTVQPPTPPSAATGAVSASSGKKRGRPFGSGRKHQVAALGSAGVGFTPHIITVKAGEDVLAKLMTFSQNTTRAVCILSANGAISNVTLRQASTSGGTVTYEGRFEILSLSGSFLLTESGGQRSRTGGLSVSLAGPDGRVLGGGVAGLLTAAAPVQVVVGSFMADGRKQSKSGQAEGLISPPKLASGASVGSPQSRGTLSESSGGPGSPLNQSTGACNNNNPQGMATMPWR
ncbi:unnamed protein product [Ilex paraguariensis]|uniref:AT-hook motif nuclear-localized protein n=1 Tax=Ilex paraguariensis TaxID=185542 RepID=A0ABC8R8A8_9AQUA